MSNFVYKGLAGVAEAELYSMFKFPESNRVHFQCDILVCKGERHAKIAFAWAARSFASFCNGPAKNWRRPVSSTGPCKMIDCDESVPEARALDDDLGEPNAESLLLAPPDDGALMASYSVFVVEPGERLGSAEPACQDCVRTAGVFSPSWLLWLCVAFGLGFVFLLIVVAFLLSAAACSCVSSELDEERRRRRDAENKVSPGNSVMQEFDPYAKSWHGSQYGSR